MTSPALTRQALALVTGAAVSQSLRVVQAAGSEAEIVAAVPLIVDEYADASAALAADHYEDMREEARALRPYRAQLVVEDRSEKLQRGVLWAVEPLRLDEPDLTVAESRMTEVVQLETARPFRETILTNTHSDPSSVGWRRIAGGDGCKFCTMLAARGAVYKQATARFASHPSCDCTAQPVFDGQGGVEASTIQYVASKRKKTPAQRARLNAYLASMPD